jgi:hypothetical protein
VTFHRSMDSVRGALGSIELATRLLRRAGTSAWSLYHVGTLPFLVALLWFCAEMSQSPYAEAHLGEGAGLLAVAYMWMKTWQALFVQQLMALLRDDGRRLDARSAARIALLAAIIQPTGLLVTTLASLLVLPLGWVIAFYHHALVACEPKARSAFAVVQAAMGHARLWPRHNHVLLFVLSLFGSVVFLNVFVSFIFLPNLVHALTGIDGTLLVHGWNPLNSTLLATTGAVAFALVDPLLKAAYAVRAFQAESRERGSDIEVALRQLRQRRARKLALLALPLALLGAVSPAQAALESRPAEPSLGLPRTLERRAAEKTRLDAKLDEVLARPDFAWRTPRDDAPERSAHRGWLERAYTVVADTARTVSRWIEDTIEWLLGLDTEPGQPDANERSAWRNWAGGSTVLLAVVALALALLWVLRRIRSSNASACTHDGVDQGLASKQDAQDLAPDRLPESEWVAEAARWLETGERRLALRALFLANLAYLAQVGLVMPAGGAHKSVGDFRRELGRRAHAYPVLYEAFCATAAIFEPIWYGDDPVTDAALERFARDSERMRDDA